MRELKDYDIQNYQKEYFFLRLIQLLNFGI